LKADLPQSGLTTGADEWPALSGDK
jgi:hypothetical protein